LAAGDHWDEVPVLSFGGLSPLDARNRVLIAAVRERTSLPV
jgi:hypothetical protein